VELGVEELGVVDDLASEQPIELFVVDPMRCGDSYRVSTDRLDVRQCPEHGRRCEHWDAIWAAR
jgi:hypothetical protein